MPNARETILTALADLLWLIPFVPVLRGEVLPERVPATGLIILRDGDPGDPAVRLSPQEAFDRLKAELTHACAASEASYSPLTAAGVIVRNRV